MALPIVTEDDVRRRVGSASFGRAKPYVGAMDDLRREGTRLRAWCQGQAPEPYAVEATLGMGGIASADCSCPVGDGGRCKHVAALVLTWIRDAAAFPEVEPFETALAQRSVDELRAIVREIVALHPDLDRLVTLPAEAGAVSAREVERDVRRILRADLYTWGAPESVARELMRHVRRASACAAAGDWAGVVVLCGAVIDGLLGDAEWLNEETGALANVILATAEPLGGLLEHAHDASARAEAVGYLFRTVRADIEIGGIDLDAEARPVLFELATPDERRGLARQVEADLDRMSGGSAWERERLGQLLLDLMPSDADDETFLRVCRASGRSRDLAERLLALNRPAEALDTACAASDTDLVALAPLFEASEHAAAFDTIAVERLDHDPHRTLVDWIKERARTRGDAALAKALAERQFFAYPSLERYAEALALGRELGREAEVRDALRAQLRERKTIGLLAEVYLRDGEPTEALRLVHAPASEWRSPGDRARARLVVAEAVAETHPEDASQMFLDAAVDAIERRGRESYRQAVRLIEKARAVYRRTPALGDWALVAAEMRDAYRGLPAFLDEMTKAGLMTKR